MDPSIKSNTPGGTSSRSPDETYEEHFVRHGSKGRSAHLYHAHPPTGWVRVEGRLRPYRFDLNKLEPTDRLDPRGWPVTFLSNAELRISVSRRGEPMPFYARNADWDELIFVHRGTGLVQTEYGSIPFGTGDYIVLPRATTYRISPDTSDNFFLVVESKGEFEPPPAEPPGRPELYDPAAVFTPQAEAQLEAEPGWEWEVRILADGEFSSVFYRWDPLDVVDWKGDLTAWKINLRDLRPLPEGRARSTFVTSGALLLTSLPRPLDAPAKALSGPYYHRNTDYDEFVFCHQRDPFSRDSLEPGMAALHPRGLHHGPHPARVETQPDRNSTEEYAVLIEAREPLQILESGALVDEPEERRTRLIEYDAAPPGDQT